MSNHEYFILESRPHGDDGHRVTCAKIECSTCHRVLWKPAKDSGVANRVFNSAGWLIGSRRSTDVCPGCRNQKRKRLDLSPAQKRATYISIEKRKVAALDAPATAVVEPVPVFSSPMREPITPVIEPALGAQIKDAIMKNDDWPDRIVIAGQPKTSATTGFSLARNALRVARAYCFGIGITMPVHGIHYYVLPGKDGFMWKDAEHTTAYERTKWKKGRTRKPFAQFGRTKELQDLAATIPERIEPMAEQPVVQRQMTRDDRRKIVDFLDHNYDQQAERWKGKGTDEAASQTLNLPRAWVAQIRVEQFGDHDRNEFALRQTAQLDEAIALAAAATNKLLTMAAEAEKIGNDLKVARSRLST